MQKVISRNIPEKLKITVKNNVYLIVFNPLSGQECVIISGFDISCQKEHEDQLLGSEEKYRTIFENSIDAIFLTTLDGNVQAANPATSKMFSLGIQKNCQ